MPDLSDRIEESASEPQSMTVDGNTATQHSLKDLIAADEYLKANAANESASRGFQIQRFKPPGTV